MACHDYYFCRDGVRQHWRPSKQQQRGRFGTKRPNIFESTFANPDPCANSSRNTGIAVGVGLGAILGAVIAPNNKVAAAAIAATAGGIAGGLVGHAVDSRRCALSKIAAKHDLIYTAAPLEVRAADKIRDELVVVAAERAFRIGPSALRARPNKSDARRP
ncbi:hypothetical protein IAG25_36190 [Caballeronia sp. EK]|jgi:outer membrane lipoprotein SlyB|uniref:glycine zipper domain-containing protein n=1 Tax=Caballeronia sp. EK TaxID=2767469 RepID=UPI0016560E6E|nr:glycine zipper domain-containing protein [Caballeronia sp. EK]MBC8642243.1 hypothetical protein [Caballeronia sp. EK]